MHHKPYIILN